jgi:hypothetical protein
MFPISEAMFAPILPANTKQVMVGANSNTELEPTTDPTIAMGNKLGGNIPESEAS